MASEQTRQTGWACRLYKNSDDKILAMDSIALVTDTFRIKMTQFHNSTRWTYKRTLFDLGIGDRIISKIQVLGDFDSYTTDSGNFLTATWNQASENENSVTMTFDSLPKVGDSL